MRRVSFALALGTGLLAVAVLGAAAAEIDQQAFSKMSVPVREEVFADHSVLSFEVDEAREADGSLHRLVALPPGTGEVRLEVLSGEAELAPPRILGLLRGRPLVSLRADRPAPGLLEVAIYHDGSWDRQAPARSRDFDRVFSALVSGLGEDQAREAGAAENGSYVIITAPDYAAAAQPLVDWKRQKGFEVVLATTAETGLTNTAIQAWLRNAYNTWDAPPEYVLLLGDVDVLPAWSFSENVSDHPYTLMDEGDWLPDLHLGRMSVEGSIEAETVVNKSVAYEREPFVDEGGEWFTRSLMVAGNYGSSTPSTTVTWCGEQLETIGFDPATTVFFPPLFNGVFPITAALEEGVSICAYRGWAYGTAGWEPPHFTVDNIPGVDNGAMMPVVMSFVCLNGNFEDDDPCFGEVFIRQGSPTERKGAVAFIGNGEHWSHTRYNDAMAIAYFEHIVDEEVSTLGQVAMAGKLSFMSYFPHELDETGDEESVEFYFHIYNLLGDPELNFWKQAPADLQVTGLDEIYGGSNFISLGIDDLASGLPLEGARLGVVQNDALLGCGFSDAAGNIFLSLSQALDESTVQITVTAPGYAPFVHPLVLGNAEILLSALQSDPADLAPGAATEFSVQLRNEGLGASPPYVCTLTTEAAGVTVTDATAGIAGLEPGASAWTADDFAVTLDADLGDGLVLPFRLDAVGPDGPAFFNLVVSAPSLHADAVTVDGDGFADPGETVEFVVDLSNIGGAGTAGGTATLTLNNPGLATLDKATAVFGAMPAGGGADNSGDAFILSVGEATAVGSGLDFTLDLESAEGAALATSFSLVVGEVDAGSPTGPDAYGYYAYDSADIDYPAEMPVYDWVTLSPRYGGSGTELVFPDDEDLMNPTTLLVDLPFGFQYYGETFTQIRVSDNGWISFDTADFFDFYNWDIPNLHGNHSLVAPFWENFDAIPDAGIPDGDHRDGIYSAHLTEEAAFVIEWSMMRHYKPEIDDFQTFQLWILDPAVHGTGPMGDGEMLFQYKQVANTDHLRNYATVGMESPDELDGLQFSYANLYAPGALTLSPGLAIRISTDAPVYDPLTLARGAARQSGNGYELSWTPADDRPVTGWRILRDGDVLVTLQAGAREYLDDHADRDSQYRLVALHPFGQKTDLGILASTIPSLFALHPASPNPSSGGAWIGFSLGQATRANLSVYDVGGRRVRTLMSGLGAEGSQSLFWDGRDEAGQPVASGVYFYRLQSGDQRLTRKLVLMR